MELPVVFLFFFDTNLERRDAWLVIHTALETWRCMVASRLFLSVLKVVPFPRRFGSLKKTAHSKRPMRPPPPCGFEFLAFVVTFCSGARLMSWQGWPRSAP